MLPKFHPVHPISQYGLWYISRQSSCKRTSINAWFTIMLEKHFQGKKKQHKYSYIILKMAIWIFWSAEKWQTKQFLANIYPLYMLFSQQFQTNWFLPISHFSATNNLFLDNEAQQILSFSPALQAIKEVLIFLHLSHRVTKPTKWHMRPAKTQISLGTRLVSSESSLSAWTSTGSLATHWAHSKGFDQTGRVPRLIRDFAGRTGHIVGFVMLQLISYSTGANSFD